MAVFVAYRSNRPRVGTGHPVDALGPQIGDAVSSASPIIISQPGLYSIWTTAAHTIFIRHKNDATTGSANGESWASGEKQICLLDEGTKIYYT